MAVCIFMCAVIIFAASFVEAYPYVSQMPIAENTDYGTIVVTVSFGRDNPILGTGTPEFYILQYRKEGEPWKNSVTSPMPDPNQIQAGYERKYTISGLESGVVYNVRLVLRDHNMNSYTGDLVPYYIVPTRCDLPDNYDYNIITSSSQRSLTFSWKYTNANERWCPVLDYQVSWVKNNGSWHTQETLHSSFMIPNYQPGDKIRFHVRTVTTGGYAPFSKITSFPKEPDEFTAYVSQMPTADNIDYGTIRVTVSFDEDNTIIGNGTPMFYTVQFRKEGEKWNNFSTEEISSVSSATGKSKNYTISGLESGVVYNVRVILLDHNKNSYEGDLVPYYIVPTMCDLPGEYDYWVTSTHQLNSLTFSWNYTNASDRWCPVLGYQVSWTEDNDQWSTKYIKNPWFEIPYHETDDQIKFHVRAVTTGGYAPLSHDYIFPTDSITSNKPQKVEVFEKTATSVVLRWNLKTKDGVEPKSFSIKLQELATSTQDDCCQQFPPLDVQFNEELPYYDVQLEGLHPAATYSVNITAPGDSAAPLTTVFTTPPPPLPVTKLPDVKVDTDDILSWLPQELANSLDNPHDYKHLIKHYLILVMPEDPNWAQKSGITHHEINRLLKKIIKMPFFVASQYTEGDRIVLEDGGYGEWDWGSHNNTDLPDDAIYRLAAAQVAQYRDVYSADVVYSTPFKARSKS